MPIPEDIDAEIRALKIQMGLLPPDTE